MRVSELAKNYEGLKSADIIAILEKNGVMGKKPQSGLDDSEIEIVVKYMEKHSSKDMKKDDGINDDDKKDNVNKSVKEKPTEEKNVKEEVVKEENVKAESVKEDNSKDDSVNVAKKKKVIIVSSGNNNQQSNQPRNNAYNNYNNNNNRNNRNNNQNYPSQRPSGPIKPRENMIDRAAQATSRREQAEKELLEEQKRKELEQTQNKQAADKETSRNAVQENVVRRPENNNRQNNDRNYTQNGNNGRNQDRPSYSDRNNDRNDRNERNNDRNDRNERNDRNDRFDRNNRFERGQRPDYSNRSDDNGRKFGDNNRGGDNRNGFNKDDNRNGGKSGFARPGQKPASKDNKSFAADSPIPSNTTDRHRDKSTGKVRDSRSKKDQLYEDDDVIGNGRNSKAGRFIKPEKPKEEEKTDDIKVIVIPETITIKDLADKMKIQPSAIVKKLFMLGEMVTVNQEISFEKAEEIALDYEIMCEKEEKIDVIAELLKEEEEPEDKLVARPPVICVMGHVDHGKTSLLDAIRKTNVTDREAGGITQAIGAYMVNINDRQITFLDTPGHEAFTSMRMRGANSTDIAILVVAADDGVMPQTVEAINHAKAAGIEIVVAVNKIDKPGANIDRVKQELSEYELIPEDWGGQTIFVPVSAKTGEGIQELLENVLLSADVLELKANPKRKARGLVIEAELDKGRGPVATVLVQKGTLKVGDFISAGASHGKVRAMLDDKGRRVKEATPSTPVEILGLDDVPNAGEIFIIHDNDKEAKNYADTFKNQNKEKLIEDTKGKMSLDDLYSKIHEGSLKELNLIIKADVQGSVEAVKQSLVKLSNEEVVVKVIHGGVGAINESDVILASASQAIIIGFNVRPDAQAKSTAEHEGVDVRLYKVIYQAIEDVESAMKGMLAPVYEEKIIGHAEVRQIFKASAIGNIAGSFVLDGMFQRNCKIRITREGEQIYEGALSSLKRFKDDVKEVKAGYECGFVFEGFDKMQELDQVEAYIMVEVPRN